jgi:hypothetical protein
VELLYGRAALRQNVPAVIASPSGEKGDYGALYLSAIAKH